MEVEMRRCWKTVVLAAMLAAPLGGCSLFPGVKLFARHDAKSMRPAMLAAQHEPGAPMTLAGRGELDAGRPGEAVEKFQKALANGEPIAAALNGMAVAYARMDRPDLAERFFREAVSVDPAEPRYQANLAALMESPAYLLARREPPAVAASAQAVAEAPRAGQLQRVSRSEVRIVSAPARSAPSVIQVARAEPKPATRSPVE